jgi:hypothetical protein
MGSVYRQALADRCHCRIRRTRRQAGVQQRGNSGRCRSPRFRLSQTPLVLYRRDMGD